MKRSVAKFCNVKMTGWRINPENRPGDPASGLVNTKQTPLSSYASGTNFEFNETLIFAPSLRISDKDRMFLSHILISH